MSFLSIIPIIYASHSFLCTAKMASKPSTKENFEDLKLDLFSMSNISLHKNLDLDYSNGILTLDTPFLYP